MKGRDDSPRPGGAGGEGHEKSSGERFVSWFFAQVTGQGEAGVVFVVHDWTMRGQEVLLQKTGKTLVSNPNGFVVGKAPGSDSPNPERFSFMKE